MIRNDTALRVSKTKLDELITHRDALQTEADAIGDQDSDTAVLKHMSIEGVDDLINQVTTEIADYETLWASNPDYVVADSIAELPTAVIRARIAAGLTLAEFATRTGLHEAAIQRYERNEYASVSCQRLQTLLEATGVTVRLNQPA